MSAQDARMKKKPFDNIHKETKTISNFTEHESISLKVVRLREKRKAIGSGIF